MIVMVIMMSKMMMCVCYCMHYVHVCVWFFFCVCAYKDDNYEQSVYELVLVHIILLKANG